VVAATGIRPQHLTVSSGTQRGGPAARRGVERERRDVVGGQSVSSADSLSSAIAAYSPGQRVTVTWTDGSGTTHSASVTLGTGPAD